jgi:uncharacterized protein (DUF433 family)
MLPRRREKQAVHILPEELAADTFNAMDYRDIITIEPGKRSGKPCIRGMRIAVQDILEYLAGGMSEDQILTDFSELTREDIRACLAFAADRERKLFVSGA